MATYEAIRVECHSGYKVNEYPVAFMSQGRRLVISEIIDRWFEGGITPERPVMNYFKIRTDGDGIYLLMYDRNKDQWFLRQGPGIQGNRGAKI